MKRAFVTGGTGFVGLNLIEQLTNGDWEVHALHRQSSDLSQIKQYPITLHEGTLHDEISLNGIMPEGLDAVFHVAGNTSTWKAHNDDQTRDNVEGTRAMVNAAIKKSAKRFIHVSTWNVYGLSHGDITEDSPKLSKDSWVNYDKTKYEAEEIVLEAVAHKGLDATIINPGHIMGRYDTHNWSKMIQLIANDKLPGIPPGSGSFCHAEALANAMINAVEKGKTGENYLIGGFDASFLDLVTMIGEKLGRKVPKTTMPSFVLKSFAKMSEMVANMTHKEPDVTPEGAEIVIAHAKIVSDKAKAELDYQAVPLDVMVDDSINWLKRTQAI